MNFQNFKEKFGNLGLDDSQLKQKYHILMEAIETPVSAVAVSAAGGGSIPVRQPVVLRAWDKTPYTKADTQNLLDYENYIIDSGVSFSDTVQLVGNATGPAQRFQGSVVAPNNMIYFIPWGATAAGKYNPVDDSFTYLAGNWSATGPAGPTGPIVSYSGTYHGGVLHPNGYIYGTPYQANAIIRIDPRTDTFDFVAPLPYRMRCHGAVLAPNNKIYFIPEDSYTDGLGITYYWQYDPSTDTLTSFGGTAAGGVGLFRGGALAPNGYIYTMPRQSGYVAKINPDTLEITTFGQGQFPGPGGPTLWRGGVLAPNGKIYAVPHAAQYVLEIDPSTDTVTTFGTFASGGNKWCGGQVAPNGKIYCFPHDTNTVLEIDPVNRSTREYGNYAGTAKWAYGVIHPNGYIYGTPSRANQVFKLGAGPTVDPNVSLSRELNKP